MVLGLLTHLDDGVEQLLSLAGCLGDLSLGVRVVVGVVRPLALVPLHDAEAGGGGGERVSAQYSAARLNHGDWRRGDAARRLAAKWEPPSAVASIAGRRRKTRPESGCGQNTGRVFQKRATCIGAFNTSFFPRQRLLRFFGELRGERMA